MPRLLSVACVLSSLVLAACGGSSGGPAGDAGAPVPVTMARVQPQPFQDSLQALGTATARESVTITAKVSETVQRVHFDSGDTVKAGAPLVTLSGQQQHAALAEAQAAASEAERLYRRQQELAAQQLIARSALDAQRATRDAANARVAQVRAQLGDRVVRAPFAGVLGLRQVSPGALVTPGTAIATLDDLDRMYVDFPVPETQLGDVGRGQPVQGRVAAYHDRVFDGSIETVDARIDPGTRAATVRAAFANADHALRPGMLVEVRALLPARQALLVPEIAVVQVGQTSFVWRVKDDGSVEQVTVRSGARRDGRVEITDGLRAGDRIVVDGTGKLRPGTKVAEAPAASVADDASATPSAARGKE
jgi:membrane fusion protein (multidrug efflux system)